MNREVTSILTAEESLRPAVHTSTNGQIVDTQGADAVLVVVTVGAITGSSGDALVKLQEGDVSTLTDAADVASTSIQGTQPAAATANTTYQFGYTGTKRYLRLVASNENDTNIAAAGVIILAMEAQQG